MLTVDTIPLRVFLLSLFVISMLAATATEFTEFQAVWRGLLILGRYVIPALACLTLKHNVIAWHRLNLKNSIQSLLKPYLLPPCDRLHE